MAILLVILKYNFFNVEHQLGTGYYPYGDLPDALDAYEDEEENIWNTD